jgi:signal transduction histidine kinase
LFLVLLEIRTPLACVIGTCSLLRYTPLSKEQGDLLNTIRVCSQQLFTLTNNILDLSKIEESKLLLESRPVYLERTLTDVVDIFVPDLVRKNVDIAINILYPEVPETIISDESRLKQILTNILSNAIKYTRDGSTILIYVKKVGSECALNNCPAKLQFEITDEGPGIPDTIPQSQLFDTFVQLDASTFRKYGGSGLGLTISKKLVNLLNGEIWYESKVGQVIDENQNSIQFNLI